MKANTLLLCLFLLLFTLAAEEQHEIYRLVDLEVAQENLPELYELGLPIMCASWEYRKDGVIITLPLNEVEFAAVNQRGFKVNVLVDDAAQFYIDRNAKAASREDAESVRQSFNTQMEYGSMGGFYTVEEIIAKMDQLYEQYGSKGLITQKESIGKTHEGREIYVFKISDNASTDESASEPQAFYASLIHAREPAGCMALFYFVHHLLENYGKDQRVTDIVNSRELYFVPLNNPDGYAYNQKRYPDGGGMHRKNRNPNNNVDLNRNFGPHHLWDYPNNGSSTSPWSQTYRGTAAFSEPEAQAIRDFVSSKNFKTALNYHTYSNLLIYPWGIKDEVAHPLFKEMATEMTRVNNYRVGTAEGLLYPVRGGTDDWFYYSCGVFAMTPEVGSRGDGFWPNKSRVFPLAHENLEANLLLAEYAGDQRIADFQSQKRSENKSSEK